MSDYRAWLDERAIGADPLFLAIRARDSGLAVGVGAYLRIDPPHGVIEIGHLAFSPLLQRRPAATEAVYLLLRRAFALGYRRCEWKCDALNAASNRAARRLGFRFEGVFRQATVCKGRNRDTAWYSILDREWPARDAALRAWLDPGNFDPEGRQRRRLSALTAPAERQPDGGEPAATLENRSSRAGGQPADGVEEIEVGSKGLVPPGHTQRFEQCAGKARALVERLQALDHRADPLEPRSVAHGSPALRSSLASGRRPQNGSSAHDEADDPRAADPREQPGDHQHDPSCGLPVVSLTRRRDGHDVAPVARWALRSPSGRWATRDPCGSRQVHVRSRKIRLLD